MKTSTEATRRAMKDASDLVRHCQRARGLSGVDISRAISRSPSEVSRALKGERNMTIASLVGLLEACGFRLVLDAVPVDASEQ